MDQWDQELRERARSEPFPLPKGYAQRLRATLANLPEGGERRRRPRFRAAALAAAAALAVFLVLPNVSPTVAYAMEDVPVLGAIVRVITLRNYDQEDETRSLHVQIPELQGAGEAGEAINEEVSAYVDALLAALNADYGIELVKTYDKGDFLTYAFRRNRHSVQVSLMRGSILSFHIYYLPEIPGYEWV